MYIMCNVLELGARIYPSESGGSAFLATPFGVSASVWKTPSKCFVPEKEDHTVGQNVCFALASLCCVYNNVYANPYTTTSLKYKHTHTHTNAYNVYSYIFACGLSHDESSASLRRTLRSRERNARLVGYGRTTSSPSHILRRIPINYLLFAAR